MSVVATDNPLVASNNSKRPRKPRRAGAVMRVISTNEKESIFFNEINTFYVYLTAVNIVPGRPQFQAKD